MLDLFIALFGGLYYGGRYASEKIDDHFYKMDQKKYDEVYNIIKEIYCADSELMKKATKYVEADEHYDEICKEFGDDLRYILGDEWKSKLHISRFRGCGVETLDITRHSTWVYYLLLAKYGKIDSWRLRGFEICNKKYKDEIIKLVECIEHRLIDAGVTCIRFALDTKGGKVRSVSSPDADKLVIERLSRTPTIRIWKDYRSEADKSASDNENSQVPLIDIFKETVSNLPIDLKIIKEEDFDSKRRVLTLELNGAQVFYRISKKKCVPYKDYSWWWGIGTCVGGLYTKLGDEKKANAWHALPRNKELIPPKRIDIDF